MMTLIQARRVLSEINNAHGQPVLLAMSGTADLLQFHLRAEAAVRGVALKARTLPFGTLIQHLLAPVAMDDEQELILLMPWDLAPECDWRSGLAEVPDDPDKLLENAARIAAALRRRRHARIAYLPAPIPPLFASTEAGRRLAAELGVIAAQAGAQFLDPGSFSLASYLANGCPIGGSALPGIGEILAEMLLAPPPASLKVLATDADDTLWAGLVSEDGPDAVTAAPEGKGYRHFIYQTLLQRLRARGILLALISRNDELPVRAALQGGRMPLTADDFVAIRTGYGPKSDQVKALAADLNLGTEAVVFVDDNSVELAEIAAALPQVTRVAFPKGEEGLPDFIDRLAGLFDRPALTAEDMERTALYRRRLAALPPAQANDLRRFLRDLDMRLIIRDCSAGDRQRPLQLINKTNQFTINGQRITEDELSAVLDRGGRLYSVRLDDRSGSHGEILACLLDVDGRVQALAMSCRVLERRVEYAFIAWLAAHVSRPLCFATQTTERNEPARRFLDHPAISGEPLLPRLDGEAFRAQHADDLALFALSVC